MSKVVLTNEKHEVFGNCVKLTNGLIELMVTVDFGPRIIHFSRVGKGNMFYEDREKTTIGEAFDVFDNEKLVLCGGHRLWASPEVLPRCYYPDSKPVECVSIENGMEFVAPIEAVNGIQKTVAVTLSVDEPSVTVTHGIKNCGQWDIELAPWAITMMAPGSVEVIPMPETQTGLLPNRTLTLWDYSAMNDPRVYWGEKFITLRQSTDLSQAFKVGLDVKAGWCAIFNKGQVFFKFFQPEDDGLYPDGGCSFETYTNGKMLEAESLGELDILEPGEWASHVEEWELYEEAEVPSNDEAEISRLILKYI